VTNGENENGDSDEVIHGGRCEPAWEWTDEIDRMKK